MLRWTPNGLLRAGLNDDDIDIGGDDIGDDDSGANGNGDEFELGPEETARLFDELDKNAIDEWWCEDW